MYGGQNACCANLPLNNFSALGAHSLQDPELVYIKVTFYCESFAYHTVEDLSTYA